MSQWQRGHHIIYNSNLGLIQLRGISHYIVVGVQTLDTLLIHIKNGILVTNYLKKKINKYNIHYGENIYRMYHMRMTKLYENGENNY
jgi:hypothetical protein